MSERSEERRKQSAIAECPDHVDIEIRDKTVILGQPASLVAADLVLSSAETLRRNLMMFASSRYHVLADFTAGCIDGRDSQSRTTSGTPSTCRRP